MPPAAPFHHRRAEVVAHLRGHGAVAVDHRERDVDRLVEERFEHRVGARVVHDHADVEIRGRVGDGCHRVVGREVDGDDARLHARVGADRGGDLFEHGLPAGEQHDVDAALGHRARERGADAVGRAGHDGPRSVPLREIGVTASRRASRPKLAGRLPSTPCALPSP